MIFHRNNVWSVFQEKMLRLDVSINKKFPTQHESNFLFEIMNNNNIWQHLLMTTSGHTHIEIGMRNVPGNTHEACLLLGKCQLSWLMEP